MKPTETTKSKENIAADWELFRDLIDRSNDAIFVVDPSTGIFIFVNDTACKSLGYKRQELLKMRVVDIETTFPDNFSWQAHVKELKEKGSLIFEGVHKRKRGAAFPIEANISYVMRNTREYLVTVVRDITERKRAEESLRMREKQLAESQRIAHIGSWEHNLTTNKVFWSDELFRLFGLDPRKDPGDFNMFFDMIHPDDQPSLKKAIEETVENGVPYNIDYRFILQDGTMRIMNAQAELIHDDTGRQVILSGTCQDVTEQKKAEEAKDRLLHAISAATEGIAMTDEKDRFIYVNDAHAKIYDCLQDELIGKTWRDTITPELIPLIESVLSKTLHNRAVGIWSGECPAVRKDGTILSTEIAATSRWNENGNYMGHICIVRDITERKRAAESLSRSEERYRSLFEDSPLSLWEEDVSDLQAFFNALHSSGVTDFRSHFADYPEDVYKCIGLVKVISVNKATLELYEAHDQAALLYDLSRVFTEDSFTSFREIMIALAEGAQTFECEAVNQTLKGHMIKVLLRWSLLPLAAGQGSHALVSIVDITDRTKAEERLRRSEEFIRSILDTVDEGFIIIDRDFRILTANKSYCGQTGGCDEEIIGRHCYQISHRTSRPCYEEGEECVVRQVFEDGQPHTAIHRHMDHDGHLLFVETKGYPIKDASGNVTSAIETINDITEKHLLEEERLKTQKLESIGTLAGGIAHDFNNLLQGIFGYISMAKMSLDQREKLLSMLAQAENALHQSVSLTTQLLTFSKGGKPVKKRISLLPVIDDAAKFALSGSQSKYRLDIEPGLWQVDADGGQLGQVIQNIVLNADQAMPEGGIVVITAKNVVVQHKDKARLPKGNYVEMSIQDSGIGIPGKYLQKIFDPYFTTKEKGSGLGLATSYSIIRSHGGVINVTSETAKGTTFSIYLPAFEAQEEINKPVPVVSSGVVGRVLVMDDEEVVRMVAGQFLTSLNHEVEFAQEGEATLKKYCEAKAEGHPFDIVILDLTVRGGMGGKETIQRLLAIDPGVRAVVSSGYSDDATVADYQKYGFRARLTKPYKIEDLRDTLDALLRE